MFVGFSSVAVCLFILRSVCLFVSVFVRLFRDYSFMVRPVCSIPLCFRLFVLIPLVVPAIPVCLFILGPV